MRVAASTCESCRCHLNPFVSKKQRMMLEGSVLSRILGEGAPELRCMLHSGPTRRVGGQAGREELLRLPVLLAVPVLLAIVIRQAPWPSPLTPVVFSRDESGLAAGGVGQKSALSRSARSAPCTTLDQDHQRVSCVRLGRSTRGSPGAEATLEHGNTSRKAEPRRTPKVTGL